MRSTPRAWRHSVRQGPIGVPSVLTQHVGFVPQGSRVLDGLQHLAAATLGRVARIADRVVTYNDAVADWAAEQWGSSGRP